MAGQGVHPEFLQAKGEQVPEHPELDFGDLMEAQVHILCPAS